MPKWIHDRAEHLLAKNPSMNKSMAFAISTQQAHATGKTPKGFGTTEGKTEAKQKYDEPKSMKKTPNPGGLDSPKLKEASLPFKPVGGFWKAQAGFTPPGLLTPAQRLQKSLNMAAPAPSNLKPLNFKLSSAMFSACVDELSKDAGIMDAIKRVAMTEVPGTKPWLLGKSDAAATIAKKVVRPAASSKRVSPGVYDVSRLARSMGM